MAKNDPVEKLLSSLAEANEATLAAIDERIAAKEAEIEEATGKLRKELAGLEQIRKVIDVQVNGPKARKNARRGKSKAEEDEVETTATTHDMESDDDSEDSLPLDRDSMDRIYNYVAVNGPCPLVDISRATKIHHHTMKKALKHEWFEQTANGYVIAKT